jgi:hypothetical protein
MSIFSPRLSTASCGDCGSVLCGGCTHCHTSWCWSFMPACRPSASTRRPLLGVVAALLLLAVVVLLAGCSPSDVSSGGPAGSSEVLGRPSVAVGFIEQVLAHSHSPALGKGQALYDLGVEYGIDPVFALAFFGHESTFGTAGEARRTLSLGNLRCIAGAACVDQARGGYAAFPTWEAGFAAWYKLILHGYVQGGVSSHCPCRTVEQIIPVYAPSRDHNNEDAYIQYVRAAVTAWRSGRLQVS